VITRQWRPSGESFEFRENRPLQYRVLIGKTVGDSEEEAE
jgi:hypothetical protein